MTSLLTDFNNYQNLYQTYKQTGCIDFKDFSNINPTTLLPLILNCFSDSNFDSNVKKDIKQYIKNQSLEEKILFEKKLIHPMILDMQLLNTNILIS